MFTKFKTWAKNRKNLRNKADQRRGYIWALVNYLTGNICECELEMATDSILFSGHDVHFDAGVKEALTVIYNLGLSDSDGYYKIK